MPKPPPPIPVMASSGYCPERLPVGKLSAVAGQPVLLFVGLNNGDAVSQANDNAEPAHPRQPEEKIPDADGSGCAGPIAPSAIQSSNRRPWRLIPQCRARPEVSWRITRDGKEMLGFPRPQVLAASVKLKGLFVLDGSRTVILFFGYKDGEIFDDAHGAITLCDRSDLEHHPETKSAPV